MSYVSIVEKLQNKLTELAILIAEGVDAYNYNTGEYPTCEMLAYEMIKRKKEKILTKLGEITWTKCYDLEDEAGYLLGSEFEITICGKTHKHLFGQDTTLPNGNVIGWETYQQAMTYRV